MLTLADLRRRARSRLDDKRAPYLWDKEELDDYINDTILDASIRANLVVQDDIQLPFTQIDATDWNYKYALPHGTLDVRSVRLQSDLYYTLRRESIQREEAYYNGRPNLTGTPYAYALDTTLPGTGVATGQYVRAIYFLSTPIAADTALLDIVRTPRRLQDDQDYPEIDGMYHPDLIYGITALAYLKRDSDTFDPKKSEEDFARFEERFGPRLPAVVLRQRQTEAPLEMYVTGGY
jgi:hypothetical protein